jgi:arylsulfatase A-like enzyme/Tfp pilus assembly protein PilF
VSSLLLLLPQSRAAATDSNIVLITVDTLRADRLGCYGNTQIATPRIDALAARGTRFASAYSQVPFTLPSHASLFTGTYPIWNGVEDTTGPPLDEHILTLAQILQRGGYATAGFPAAFVLDSFFGLGRGFDAYYGSFPHRDMAGEGEESGLTRSADEQLPMVFHWLNRNASKKFFLWVHLYDTHHPYHPPEPYRTQYADRPYDAEVAYIDSAIGQLLDYLAAKQLTRKTVVVLTSDHGEGLGEHGELYHGYFIYNSTLHVPLIIYDPSRPRATGTVADNVSLIDVAPTLLASLGEPIPRQMQGRSLLGLMSGKTEAPQPIVAESLFPNLHFGWSGLYSVQLGRWKYVDAPRPELYDLSQDPGEVTNLYASHTAVGDALGARLKAILARYRRNLNQAPLQLTEQEMKQLQKLGYVGDTPKPLATGALADPKDTLPLYNLYLTALAQQEDGQWTAAVASYQQILASGYQPPVIYHGLGNVYLRLHDNPHAIENLKLACARNPASEPYLLDLARAYEANQQNKEAAATYVLALALNPKDYAALNNLAVMYIKLNDWEDASSTLERAAVSSPLKETYYHLGICYEHQGRDQAAAAQFHKALAIDNGFAAAHYNLGVVETRQGSVETATAEFQSAIAADPNVPEAHFSLGVLYARRAAYATAKNELARAVQLKPDFPEAHFNLAVVDMQLMHLDEARAEFATAIAQKPEFLEAHQGLASLYGEMGLDTQATAELDTVHRLQNQHK